MQTHTSFDKLVESYIFIEDVLICKGNITLQSKENKSSSNSQHKKDKNKFWNKTKDVFNNKIVGTTSMSTTAKPKEATFNLSTIVKAKNDKPWAFKPKINFTYL